MGWVQGPHYFMCTDDPEGGPGWASFFRPLLFKGFSGFCKNFLARFEASGPRLPLEVPP